jgi:hypothetical protein
MRRSALALLLLLSAACAHGPAARSGPGVLIAPAELARQTGLEPWAIMGQAGARVATGTSQDVQVEPGRVPARGQGPVQRGGPLNSVTLCGYHPVTRMLTRYAFEDAINYMPPQLSRIREARPELRLEETDAECLPREPRAPAVNRIEALAYGGSGPKAALDASTPAVPVRYDL